MTSHIHEPSRWRIAHLSGLCDCFVGCTNGSQQQDEDDDPACILDSEARYAFARQAGA